MMNNFPAPSPTGSPLRLAAFDIEIAHEIPPGANWRSLGSPGITCAALAFSDNSENPTWEGRPQLSRQECQALVRALQQRVRQGYTLLTWNGCAFDFAVLAQESGLPAECAQLAKYHVDLMLMVAFKRGVFLSLDKALKGARLEGKLKSVRLNDGRILEGMGGAMAPGLWAAGEYAAVLAYLKEDVGQLLKLAAVVQRQKAIRWESSRGAPQTVYVERLCTVDECFAIPKPVVTGVRNPARREDFIAWAKPWWNAARPIDRETRPATQPAAPVASVQSAGSSPASPVPRARLFAGPALCPMCSAPLEYLEFDGTPLLKVCPNGDYEEGI